jgi:hypothetical protein
MDTRDPGRATVRRALGSLVSTAVGAAVMDARDAGRATVRRALGSPVSATVVDARDAGRATVRRALLLARILLRISHGSSRELDDQDQAPNTGP